MKKIIYTATLLLSTLAFSQVGINTENPQHADGTFCEGPDTDGDGIPDMCDDDADNDGIPNCIENGFDGDPNTAFKANGSATAFTNPSGGSAPTNQFRLTNGGNQSGQAWSYGKIDFAHSFKINMKVLLSAADGIAIVFHNSPLGTSASGIQGQGLGARGIANGIALELDTFPNSCTNDNNNGANCDPAYDHGSIRKTAGTATSGWEKLAGDGQLGDGTVDDGFWHDVEVSWDAITRNLSYTFDGADVTNYTFPTSGPNALETIFGGTTNVYFGFTGSTGSSGSNNSIGFNNPCEIPLYFDTDGDGIPDYLDLDSDNDGCPDAIEGDGNISQSQLDADGRIIGDVDENGIPTVVNGGQGIGSSQDVTVNSCPIPCTGPDSDGDGIPDMCDLDSDNDGIPDLVENCKGYYSQNQNGPWSGDSTSTLTVTTSSGVSFQDNVENLSLDQRYKYYTNTNGANRRLVNYHNNSAVTITYTFSPAIPAKEIAFFINDVDNLTASNGTLSNYTIQINGSTPDYILAKVPMSSHVNMNYNEITGSINSVGPLDNQRILLKGQGDHLVSSITLTSNSFGTGDSVAYNLYGLQICDTDGDGIPDNLDLDSDGDGCPDAIEGGGNFTADDLTTASGDLTSQSVNQNFGVDVDGNGIPVIVGASGQDVGSSKDATVNACSVVCTKPNATGTPDGFTKVGITVQQKQDAWPENIPNGWIALESKEKGFVITRVSHVGGTDGTPAPTDAVTNPKEGMVVYDIADKCVKLYNGTVWNCIQKSCNE